MNTEKELQSFFVNNLHMENQLYIYASLQKLESGNWEFLIFWIVQEAQFCQKSWDQNQITPKPVHSYDTSIYQI